MVPKGWKRQPLEQVAEVRSGVAKGKTGLKDPVCVPYLRVANVQDGHINLEEVKEIEIERDKLERFSLKKGDVLMNEGGDFDKLGRGDVWLGQIEPCLHQNHVFAVRPDEELIDSFYLAALAASNYGKTYFLSCAKRSTNLASINSSQIKEFPVLVPPLPEQKKIAKILSAWDKAITTTEQLLANSQQQKKALMQQLLTGKKRLLDNNGVRFSGEWQQCIIEDFFDVGSSKRVLQDDWKNEGTPFYRTRELVSLSKNEPFRSEVFIADELFHELSIKYGAPKPGDFLVSGVGTLGISYQVKDGDRFYFKDGNVLWFKIKEGLFSDYFKYCFQSDFLQEQIVAQASITTVGTYTIQNAKKTKFWCPPSIAEQQKISAVLSTADQEIAALQQKLDALKQEKMALMQQLLTGKKRVIV
ncbi:restriction endonuclease subunit S [Aeromonas sp. JL9]|uniref:restriction endonuclease subunit S n=1 Tax=Aeromonas sp. JL9 TaxID=2950549 RepID=UPI00210C442C|nr:restriction endonuclease subunit S [Aeromonas sp. JL9]MCQ4110375.1 restriction endonuclease subunit S [Aeromonas sp. JL9]